MKYVLMVLQIPSVHGIVVFSRVWVIPANMGGRGFTFFTLPL